MKTLELLAKASAILAGLLLIVVTLVICASLTGRNTTGWTVAGYELIGVAAGAGIALFMPWGQLRRANIVVDFFTAGLKPATHAVLDRVGAALLGLAIGILAWRAAIGGWHAWQAGSATMMLALPEWIVYAVLVPPLALSTAIAFAQAAGAFPEQTP